MVHIGDWIKGLWVPGLPRQYKELLFENPIKEKENKIKSNHGRWKFRVSSDWLIILVSCILFFFSSGSHVAQACLKLASGQPWFSSYHLPNMGLQSGTTTLSYMKTSWRIGKPSTFKEHCLNPNFNLRKAKLISANRDIKRCLLHRLVSTEPLN